MDPRPQISSIPIPFSVLDFNKSEILNAVEELIDSGSFILGKTLERFEFQFADFMQMNHAVGVANGTQALELAIKWREIPAGSYALTVANAGLPTVMAIRNAGLRPIFCDVTNDGLMDYSSVARCLKNSKFRGKIKLIVPVHLYGQIVNLTSYKQFGIPIIEDAAQAVGSHSPDYRIGTGSDASIVSFYPSKALGGFGDSGAVLVNSPPTGLIMLRNYGVDSLDHAVSDCIVDYHKKTGMNSRMDDLQAAMLLCQMRHFHERKQARLRIAEYYVSLLQKPLLHRSYSSGENQHLFTVVTPERERMLEEAKKRGIGLKVHYPRSMVKVFGKDTWADPAHGPEGSITQWLCESVVSLPLYSSMTMQDAERVRFLVNEFYE